jgi:hypothetical protein
VSRSTKCPIGNARNTKNTPKNALFNIAPRTINYTLHTTIQTYKIEASNSSNYFHFPHVTKQDYNRAFNNAHNNALKDPKLTPTSAARIYHVKEEALHKSVFRARQKQRNSNGLYNIYEGNNKVLNKA